MLEGKKKEDAGHISKQVPALGKTRNVLGEGGGGRGGGAGGGGGAGEGGGGGGAGGGGEGGGGGVQNISNVSIRVVSNGSQIPSTSIFKIIAQ